MTNAQLVFLIFQTWLLVAVAHPIAKKSNACFIHAMVWWFAWIWMVLR